MREICRQRTRDLLNRIGMEESSLDFCVQGIESVNATEIEEEGERGEQELSLIHISEPTRPY